MSTFSLPNGMRVIVVEHHRKPVVVVDLLFPRGALTDPADGAGLSYLAFELASDYYETEAGIGDDLQEKSFRRKVIDLGGSASFQVESDFALAQISGYAQDAAAYLRMLAGAVSAPRHGAQSFIQRRRGLLIAFDKLESSDSEVLRQVMAEAAFGSGHPYARSLIGTTASLVSFGLEDVVSRQNELLVPGGATLLVVGDVKPEQIAASARTAFARWTGTPLPEPQVLPPEVPPRPAEVGYLERRAASTLQVCATRPLPDVRGSDAALDVLAAILGKGMKSRLGETLREQNGLTYAASAGVVRRRHARAFIACSPLRSDKSALGVRLFRGVLDGMRDAPPSGDEVERAKGLRLAEIESAYDDASSATRTWLKALTLGTGAPRLEAEHKELEQVTAAEVQKLGRTVLRPQTIRWVVSGERRAASQAFASAGFGKLQALAPGR